MSKILIVGSGITGCTAALELARQGYAVDVIESGCRVGGKVLSYCCKATDECSRCGVCVAHTTIAEALKHPRINFVTGASIQSVRNTGKNIFLRVARRNPTVSHDKCVGCDACVEACPAKCITKYDRGGLVQYFIDHAKCLRRNGEQCNKCVAACPTSAISGRGKTSTFNITAGAVLIATGHQAYDASQKPRLGYGRLQGVITGEEAEEILSTQTYLSNPSEDVAFVQCVGSRDPQIGRNYCSSVCCPYAVRMARALKYRNPDGNVTVYYIDLQNFDKTFSFLRRSLLEEDINFIRAIPFSINKSSNGKLKLKIEGSDGNKRTAEHDMVVLSVGMGPTSDSTHIAELFDLEQDEFGFFNSSIPNVFVAGTCVEPQSISDSMASTKAVAAEILQKLPVPPAEGPYTRTLEKAGVSDTVETKKVRLCQRVLVLGGGIAGARTAHELKNYGYRTTLVECSDKIGGQIVSSGYLRTDFARLLSGVDVMTEARISKLSGNVGSFTVRIETSSGAKDIEYGAIVVSSGTSMPAQVQSKSDFGNVTSIADLDGAMARFSNRDRPRSIGFILDMNVEETKASTEMALRPAIDLRKKYRCEAYVFCRQMRVDSKNLENLLDEAKNAGVNIIKYDGSIKLEQSENDVPISVRDCLLSEDLVVACGIVGISPYGVSSSADKELAGILGIGTDSFGQMQDNNIHLFPELTNRPGIFVVGACRGRYYVPEIINDAQVTALSVHSLLSQKDLVVELSNAVVDANKCALCLTCVRVCPHGAMTVDMEKRAAVSIPEVCQKCGVCVGECPGGAIEFLALSGVEGPLSVMRET